MSQPMKEEGPQSRGHPYLKLSTAFAYHLAISSFLFFCIWLVENMNYLVQTLA
jgi:hypothetical protein